MALPRSSRLLATAVLCGCYVCGTAARAGTTTNCISNGGFEAGLANWNADAKHTLLSDPKQSHAGQHCLTGKVASPNQALRLRRDIPVRSGSRYDLTIWARATPGTKMVLWAVRPGKKQREMIASWTKLARGWRPYKTTWVAQQSGAFQFELICPSSYGAHPGQIWIDDVVLQETRMPPSAVVSDTKYFCDEPAMAITADGTIFVAYNRFVNGQDSLQLVRLRWDRGKPQQILGRWTVIQQPKTYVLHPRLIACDDHVQLVYAAEQVGNWDIYSVACDAQGPGTPVRVTHAAGVDTDPSATWAGSTLWIAWESNRTGRREIYATAVHDGQVAAPRRVSQPDVSSYDPSIAVTAAGTVAVAWHAFDSHNYDIYFSRRQSAERWQAPRRLTRAATIDRHACLFTQGADFYVAYENAATKQYHIGATNQRHLVVARITAAGLQMPMATGATPLAGRSEAANAQFDTAGRLWVALLQPRLPRSGWDAVLTSINGPRWSPPAPLSTAKGMDRQPVLALHEGRAIVALQGDTIPPSWSDLDKTDSAQSRIYLVQLDTASTTEPTGIQWAPLAEPDTPFEAAGLRVQHGEDRPTPSIEYRGQQLRLFYGDLHEHSDISVCNRVGDQSLDESYQHMRDLARYDFVCVTDHGYNMNPYLWQYSAKLARVNDDPGRYLTFLGQEWTSTFEEYSHDHPYGFYGHRNLILADLYFPKWWNARSRQTPTQIWDDLHRMHANFVHIPHQLADTGNVPTDWSFHNETDQPVAEIFQTRGSYEYLGAPRQAARAVPNPGYFLQDAWALGIVIGVVAAPDHGGGYGKACVYAPELTREAILDALRARHCYGTTAAKIELDVRVNEHLMGEKIPQSPTGPVTVRARVRCPQPIDRIEVCRSNTFIHRINPLGNTADMTFVDRQPLNGTSYYYVRVIQRDEEIAWSSPVWFGTGHSATASPDHSHKTQGR